jgi:hypothetical protein
MMSSGAAPFSGRSLPAVTVRATRQALAIVVNLDQRLIALFARLDGMDVHQ